MLMFIRKEGLKIGFTSQLRYTTAGGLNKTTHWRLLLTPGGEHSQHICGKGVRCINCVRTVWVLLQGDGNCNNICINIGLHIILFHLLMWSNYLPFLILNDKLGGFCRDKFMGRTNYSANLINSKV